MAKSHKLTPAMLRHLTDDPEVLQDLYDQLEEEERCVHRTSKRSGETDERRKSFVPHNESGSNHR